MWWQLSWIGVWSDGYTVTLAEVQEKLQVAQAKVCSNLFSSWFLGSSAFSCLQLQWPSWPSVSILGVLPSFANALGDDGGCTIQICTDPYSQLMSTAIIPGPGELQFYQRNLSGLGSLGMACAAAFSS